MERKHSDVLRHTKKCSEHAFSNAHMLSKGKNSSCLTESTWTRGNVSSARPVISS